MIFDANGATVAVESWGVLVTSQCLRSDFHRCVFRNASGASLGSGLVFQSSDPALTEHVVRDCTFSGNAAHGLWVQACAGVLVAECRAFGNARYGIVVDYNDAAFVKKARLALVIGNRCWANQRGISIGNFNATNAEPARWGNANPDAIAVLVANNICHDNSIYGVAISGNAIAVQGNVLSNNGIGTSGGGGVLANAAYSSVSSNTVTGAAVYGIDCGGSIGLDVRDNVISGPMFGINCGGGQFVRVDGNRMQDCSVFAVSVNNVETDGAGGNFGMACSGTSVCNNWIALAGTAGGVWLRDGPQLVHVARNHFVGTGLVGNCLWADTDSLLVEGNRYNFSARHAGGVALVGGLQQMVFPDIADDIVISAAPGGVGSMVSSRQSQMAGKIAFVRITAGGSGYTSATLAIGGAGAGAVAQAVVSDGAIIGAVVSAAGSGYGGFGMSVPITITGNGTGATAVACAGLPLPEERRLRVRCDVAVRFTAAGASPAQGNWTGADITMQAGSDIDWTVANGGWRAGQFSASHTLAGQVRRVALGEAVGCSSGVGRGSPQGVVAAAPGSDWRNLDGGAGGTYWIKQSGTGSSGWVAVA